MVPLAFVMLPTPLTADAQKSDVLNRAIHSIQSILPTGWTVVERLPGEIPWGHYWCSEYQGPKGTKIVLIGTKSVSVQFLSMTNVWSDRPVARESIELWLMPAAYADTWWSWFCHHRPIQPIHVFQDSSVGVFGQVGHRLNSKAEFDALLSKSAGNRWPDSPVNRPELLSWQNWQSDVSNALKREFVN